MEKAVSIFFKRFRSVLSKRIFYPLMNLKFMLFGMPKSEEKCIQEYFKTYNAKRYLASYANNGIKRVFIQIGMDKTASTTIQHFLVENQDWLHSHSADYKSDWGTENHSVPIMSLLREQPEKIQEHILRRYDKRKIAEYNYRNLISLCKGIRACPFETYIFYGEGICSFTQKEFMRFRDLLKALMPEAGIKLMYCTRSNTGYASSAYQQAMKTGRFQNCDDTVNIYSGIYEKRIKNAVKVFGKDRLSVYKFEDAVNHIYGPVGYFIDKIGLPAS